MSSGLFVAALLVAALAGIVIGCAILVIIRREGPWLRRQGGFRALMRRISREGDHGGT